MLVVSTSYHEQNNLMVFSLTGKLVYGLVSTIVVPERVVFMELVEKR